VENNSGNGVLGVSVDRAAFDAVGIQAVIAAHGEVVAPCVGVDTALDLTDSAPEDVCGIPVLLVAGDLAGAASDALGYVEVEAVLFAFGEGAIRDQLRIESDDDLRGLEGLAEVCECHADDGVTVAVLCAFVQWK
jgi:hypothetical protein